VKRVLIVCPGRGSYDRSCLGSLKGRAGEAGEVVARADAWREAHDRPTVTAMDSADGYQSKLHVAGENASILTATCSLADFAELNREKHEVVGVVGNSMGWYTALGVAGALSLDDTIRLIDTMGAYQQDNVIGGQVIHPLVDDQWRPDPALAQAVEEAIASAWAAGHQAWWSIRLGGYAVLGGDEGGIKHLLDAIPKLEKGTRTFPARLPLHSAFHTPLMTETSLRAKADLADLDFRAPNVPLIDGRGRIHRPRWASPADLWEYTLGAQVVDVYDLTTSVRTALRHCGADLVVALGPGNSLGAALASILVAEGWGGCRDRASFDARQAQDPLLLAFGVTKQRQLL
jgi:[acyl-carrier-protein] S-malonyltransferase